MIKTSAEILREIEQLIDYCKSDKAKRSQIIHVLKKLEQELNDKYVIELKEVIKGYGNDPQVKDPLRFPCDYKFYEIDGVAICENSFKKMKKLEDIAITKDQYKENLTELRSMALIVKHNIASVDPLIDRLDDLLSEVNDGS